MVASSDANLQTVSDFWLFLVYCLVVVVVILFFLFYFNPVLGQIIAWIINQYMGRRYGVHITVDSIRVTLLGARILFKNLRYITNDYQVSILKGHVSVRYWLTNVRKANSTTKDNSELPCRILCSVEGLECFIYNNTLAYEKMKDVLGMKTPDSDTISFNTNENCVHTIDHTHIDPETLSPTEAGSSLLQRLMPIEFECTIGAIVVGNPKLRSKIIVEASQANGTWSTAPAPSSLDHYRSILQLVLRKPMISIKENVDFFEGAEESSAHARTIARLWRRMSRFFRFLLLMKGKAHQSTKERLESTSIDQDGTERDKRMFHDEYAMVSNILDCSEASMEFYSDYAGPVPASTTNGNVGPGIDVGNGGPSPEFGLRLCMWNPVIHYGPWADRERAIIQDYFFPSSHRDNKPTERLSKGNQRIPTSFDFHVSFMTNVTIRVPTREKSKDWKYTTDGTDQAIGADGPYARPYGWIDINADEGSYVKMKVPFVMDEDGCAISLAVQLRNVDAITSVNYASFICAKKLELNLKMNLPLEWNTHRVWDFQFAVSHPEVNLLRDHCFLIQDLVKDWTSTPSAGPLYFIPVTYQINLELTKPLLRLCVNEQNIINNPNVVEDNAFVILSTHTISFNARLPQTEYQPDINAIFFGAEIEQLKVAMSMQASHTHNAFLREDDAQVAVGVNVALEGSYQFYSTVDVLKHIESLNLHFKLKGVTVKLFGTVIRYLLILRDNYVGSCVNFLTTEEYRIRKDDDEYHASKKRQIDQKPPSDPFEVYVLCEVQDSAVLLPENLYECSHYSQLEFRELQLELRNTEMYMDMIVDVSSITWTRESSPYPNKRQTSRIKNARDPRNYLYIDDTRIYAHRLFGPMPATATYLCKWNFDIGRITGEIKPSFLLGVASFAQSLIYNLVDEDNAVSSEFTLPTDPDVTFLNATVRDIDICLMSRNSASNLCLKKGVTIDFDNLCNEKYSQRIGLRMPDIVITCLANQEQGNSFLSSDDSDYSWVEVARIDLGLNITIFRQAKGWRKLRRKQQNFIKFQDAYSSRCVHLYEDPSRDNDSSSSMHTTNVTHNGGYYAPPFRTTMSEYDNISDGSMPSTPASETGSFRGGYHLNDSQSAVSYLNGWDDTMETEESEDDSGSHLDVRSMTSAASVDNDSFYTANSVDSQQPFDADSSGQSYDNRHSHSSEESRSENEDEPCELDGVGKGKLPKNQFTTTAIPPSIPYSDYLNRYSIHRANCNANGRFFEPFLPPPKIQLTPLKPMEKETLDSTSHQSARSSPRFYAQSGDDVPDMPAWDGVGAENKGRDSHKAGNEAVATTVLEATSPVKILLTPILVKVVQELSEVIDNEDWDLETMLDSLQIQYIAQLTRYLAEKFTRSRFAVRIPSIHLYFIQNVMIPDDLPSYKHDHSHIHTQYDNENTMLCSADIHLDDLSVIGSVKLQDLAFESRNVSVAESFMSMKESRVHINFSRMGCKVQYVSEQINHARQAISFGIPSSRQHLCPRTARTDYNENLVMPSELVVLDLELNAFEFKWLGAQHPNYLHLEIGGLSTVIITEAVEILVGAVYSWLVFVDDLQRILEGFNDRRSRQVQVFIHELATFSRNPGVTSDPLFLTTPESMLRLGTRNIRTDVGWKLLARMRQCLRMMPTTIREKLQYRLTSGRAIQDVDPRRMYLNVVELFSKWRDWEINPEDIRDCRLFTLPYKQLKVSPHLQEQTANDLAKFLSSSVNFIHLGVGRFRFCIYEEEEETDDNSVTVGPIEFSLESAYRRSTLEDSHQEERNTNSNDSSTVEGYLDVITKASLGKIHVVVNPTILAFARHMLTVQRVFTTKLNNLSRTTKAVSTASDLDPNLPETSQQGATTPSSSSQLGLKSLMKRIDIIAQALVNIDTIEVVARAQKLVMQTTLLNLASSMLFSNPKLTPLVFLSPSDRADSDTGSGRPSTAKAMRKQPSTRIVFQYTGLLQSMHAVFSEELQWQGPIRTELLSFNVDQVRMNANMSQRIRKKNKVEQVRELLNIFSGVDKFSIHAPQSLRKLYGFVEEWRAEQGKRYHFMFQNLLKEWEEQRRTTTISPTAQLNEPATVQRRKYDISLQFLLRQFVARADLLKSLSMEYSIHDMLIFVRETQLKAAPLHKYSFQLTKQDITIIKYDGPRPKSGLAQSSSVEQTNTFSIPGIRSEGSLRRVFNSSSGNSHLLLDSTISVDFIALSLNVSMVDSLLTAQNLLGNELSDLVEMLSYTKQRRQEATSETSAVASLGDFKYTFRISLVGLRVSAASPSALGLFESNALRASISNDKTSSDQLAWRLQGQDFSLSLDHNTVEMGENAQRNRLAYMLVDFTVQNHDTETAPSDNDDNMELLAIDITKFHTVMQPIALGKLAEMYIYYDTELKKKKEEKKSELERLAKNTKRLVQSFKNEIPGSQEDIHALWEHRLITLKVQKFGVAIPLDVYSLTERPHRTPKQVNALLLSIVSIEFTTKNAERSRAKMENATLKFVRRFDQSNEEHFVSANHVRMNQMHLPSVICYVQAYKEKPKQYVDVTAQVTGFEIDIDGTLADHLNNLNTIYLKCIDRVDEFTARANLRSKTSEEKWPTTELVHLHVKGAIEYQRGIMRMYPKRHADELSRKRDIKPSIADRTRFRSEGHDTATINLPGMSADFQYQTPLGEFASVADAPRRFHSNVKIHECENVLHPSLVEFLREMIRGLKLGVQRSSERKAAVAAAAARESTLLRNTMEASILLRLSKTKLDLSCLPASKVMCCFGWNDSEFLLSTSVSGAATRILSCAGSLREVTAEVKHPFSPDAFLSAKIERVMLNAMLTSKREEESHSDDISIIVNIPAISGGINVRTLQEVLILKRCWLDQPILSVDTAPPVHTKGKEKATARVPIEEVAQTEPATDTQPMPFTKYIVIQTKTIDLLADLGPMIGRVTIAPDNFLLRTQYHPNQAKKLNVAMDSLKLSSIGRLAGEATLQQTQLVCNLDLTESLSVAEDTAENIAARSSFVSLKSDGLTASFEYEYQNLLFLMQEAIEFRSSVTCPKGPGQYHISTKILFEPLFAKMTIGTVPNIVTMYGKFTDMLHKKMREGMYRTHPSSKKEKVDEPSTSSQAVAKTPSNLTVHSDLQVDLHLVEIVVYQNQFLDTDNADIRASQLSASLIQVPSHDRIHRTLELSLTSIGLNKSVKAPPGPEGWKNLENDMNKINKSLGGTVILGIPTTKLTMDSRQVDFTIEHEFAAQFDGRLNLTLNLGLVKYLQELYNVFNHKLEKAREKRIFLVESLSSGSQENLEATPEPPAAPAAEEESKQELTYTTLESVNFQPQLQLMGDATPPVEWLGLRRDRLPALVHENVTVHLDQLVQTLWQFYLDRAHPSPSSQ